MLDEVGAQRKQDWMGQPVWRDAMDGLNGFFRDNGEDRPEMAAKAHNARSLLKKSFGDWMAKDPNRATDFAAQRQFLDQTITAIVPEIRKQTFVGEAQVGSAWGTPKAAPSATTPSPGAKPAQPAGAAPAVAPAGPGTSWQTQKMFGDYAELTKSIAEWRSSKGAPTAALSQMASKLGLKTPQEIMRFVEAQGKLFVANPTGN